MPVWKEAPFLRLVVPFIAGIAIQWYLSPPFAVACILAGSAFIALIVWQQTSFIHYRQFWIRGMLLNLLLTSMGWIVTVCRDDTFRENSLLQRYTGDGYIIAKLEEPLSEKVNSFQAKASVHYLISAKARESVQGLIVLYFKKENPLDSIAPVQFGEWIIVRKRLQTINYTGNPAAFDYQRYCRLQQIRFSVLLDKKEWSKLSWYTGGFFQRVLILTREKILTVIRRFLSGDQETALAEALLIGYRNDLDRDLSLAYSNTGVVHIIAISGLHLALIYELIAFFLRPLRSSKSGRWLRIALIIFALWGFSYLSGASPSVLRSAMMFTCIALGEGFSKKASIYNNLCASAFLLLCYNPYWLWDIGFQLSYTAVLSIVIFMKPIYKHFFSQNRIVDFIWKSVSVTLAAQILTVPICIYQFHQFPIYFLPANLVAVPLSSVILLGELLICAIAFVPFIAAIIGHCLSWLIWLLNHFIGYMAQLPFSIWNGLEISTAQCWLMYLTVACFAGWYFYLEKKYLTRALLATIGFGLLRTISFFESSTQKKLIVYNVPHHQVVDCLEGRSYFVKEDTSINSNPNLLTSYCKPARAQFRTTHGSPLIKIKGIGYFFAWHHKRILIIDHALVPKNLNTGISLDCVILSKNPPVSIQNLEKMFNCQQYVFDASNKIQLVHQWEKECDQRKLGYYNVAAKGAFVMNMD